MTIVLPVWVRRPLRIVGWLVWQSIVALWALILFATLFAEYGRFNNRFVNPVAAIAFLAAAMWLGTWIPVRSWIRSERAQDCEQRRTSVRARALLLFAATALCNVSCADDSRLASFNKCLLGPVETVREGTQRVEVTCELPDDYLLLGVPGRRISPDELTHAGVPADLAHWLIGSEL